VVVFKNGSERRITTLSEGRLEGVKEGRMRGIKVSLEDFDPAEKGRVDPFHFKYPSTYFSFHVLYEAQAPLK